MTEPLCTCPERGDPDWNGSHEIICPWRRARSSHAEVACERLAIYVDMHKEYLDRDRDILLLAIYKRVCT